MLCPYGFWPLVLSTVCLTKTAPDLLVFRLLCLQEFRHSGGSKSSLGCLGGAGVGCCVITLFAGCPPGHHAGVPAPRSTQTVTFSSAARGAQQQPLSQPCCCGTLSASMAKPCPTTHSLQPPGLVSPSQVCFLRMAAAVALSSLPYW